MRFEIGQWWTSASNSNLLAEIVQLSDGGRAAAIDVQDARGELLEQGTRVVYQQFAARWNVLSK